ncbi:MAG: M20/M25/M40 family metallo-hydrolase [Bacteroidales bacterium]
MKRNILIVVISCLVSMQGFTQQVSEENIRKHLRVLASDSLRGRRSASEDEKKAAYYIRGYFKDLGLTLLAEEGVQPFEFKKNLKSQNVVARLEGTDPQLKAECIVIGGHYDHIGDMGLPYRRTILKGGINYGADDNASGTALMMEMARILSENRSKLKRSVVFVAFGSEEQGLQGSKAFTAAPPEGTGKMVAMLNFDMVGRLDAAREIFISGAGTAEGMEEILKEIPNPDQMKLVFFKTGKGPTDSESFYEAGIPVVSFITGLHRDYHTPRDVEKKINYAGISSIGNYALDLSLKLINREQSLAYTRNDESFSRSDIDTPEPWQYKSHLSGIYGGFAGLSGKNLQGGVPAGYGFLECNPARSGFFGITFFSGGLRIFRGLGITSGLGLETTGLVLKKDFTLLTSGSVVAPDSSFFNRGINLDYNSFNLTRFTLPLMLELKSKQKGKSAYIAAGVIGALQVGSNQQLRYKEDDHKFNTIIRGSYHTNPLVLSLGARAGYGHAGLFFNYQLNPLFKSGNPAVYPFTAGLSWNFRK